MSFIKGFISAASHVVEPQALFTNRVEQRFRDQAPHVESPGDEDYFVIPEMESVPVGVAGAIMNEKIAGEIKSFGGDMQTGDSNVIVGTEAILALAGRVPCKRSSTDEAPLNLAPNPESR